MKLIRTLSEAEPLIGKKVIIINEAGGHKIPIGTIVTITSCYNNGSSGYLFYHDYNTTCLKSTNFNISAQTKKQLESELIEITAKFKLESKTIEDKIKFINESGSTEFDEMQFKAYQTLNIIDKQKLSKIEKAKLIAELLK